MANKRVSENIVAASTAPVRRKSASPKRIARPTAVEVAAPASESEIAAEVTPAASLQDAVARLAYSYWEARGYQGGSPEADWLRAEQELSAR